MKRVLCLVTLFIASLTVCGQSKTAEQKSDLAFYEASSKWFSAWKLISKNIYKIGKVTPVEFIFFDDTYVYSTSKTTIKRGAVVKGCNLMNLKLQWEREVHNGSITLPDKSVVPVTLMSFAAEIPAQDGKSYFVMPLPSFWSKSGVLSNELGLENLITGVFIHEFSHSQQMQNFGKKMTEYEQQNNFGVEFSDDVVQDIFSTDTSYLGYFNKEIELLYSSIKDKTLDKTLLNEGLTIIQQRQEKYFTENYETLKQIDNFFLTMEGLGQYSMFLWLKHPKGGNIKKDIQLKG